MVRSHFFSILLHNHISICKNHSPLLLESLDDENSFPTALLEKYVTFKKSVSSERQLFGKVPDAGKDRGQKEKRESENEMGLESITDAVTPGEGEGQGSLSCCSSWDRRVGHNWAAEQQKNIIVLSTMQHAMLKSGCSFF